MAQFHSLLARSENFFYNRLCMYLCMNLCMQRPQNVYTLFVIRVCELLFTEVSLVLVEDKCMGYELDNKVIPVIIVKQTNLLTITQPLSRHIYSVYLKIYSALSIIVLYDYGKSMLKFKCILRNKCMFLIISP